MSKSILIKGADFSQNGFRNPVINPEIIRGRLINGQYSGCYMLPSVTVGQPASSSVYKAPRLDGYAPLAVAKFEVQTTDIITAIVDLQHVGNGLLVYFIADANDEIIFISDQRTIVGEVVRPYNNIISDIPQNAAFIYYQIELGQNYSFTREE